MLRIFLYRLTLVTKHILSYLPDRMDSYGLGFYEKYLKFENLTENVENHVAIDLSIL
jgi:hypothetical protein